MKWKPRPSPWARLTPPRDRENSAPDSLPTVSSPDLAGRSEFGAPLPHMSGASPIPGHDSPGGKREAVLARSCGESSPADATTSTLAARGPASAARLALYATSGDTRVGRVASVEILATANRCDIPEPEPAAVPPAVTGRWTRSGQARRARGIRRPDAWLGTSQGAPNSLRKSGTYTCTARNGRRRISHGRRRRRGNSAPETYRLE
jgi:hypothetical protein